MCQTAALSVSPNTADTSEDVADHKGRTTGIILVTIFMIYIYIYIYLYIYLIKIKQ